LELGCGLFWSKHATTEKDESSIISQLEMSGGGDEDKQQQRSRSPSMGVAAAALSRSPERRETLGILRLDARPRRSSGTSVEFRDLQVSLIFMFSLCIFYLLQ
jgi:hypothetical protein